MTYEQQFTSISIRVPKSLRDEYAKTKDFWESLGEFFADMSLLLTENELRRLKLSYPTVTLFVEDVLP